MEKKIPDRDPSGAISRTRLEAVIRRAAELYAAEAETDDSISEPELIRIAAELGLPARLVQQALYEVEAPLGRSTLTDRLSAPSALRISRVVPQEPQLVSSRLEDFLVTRGYFQVTNRGDGRVRFSPAADLVSHLARSMNRLVGNNALNQAQKIDLDVRSIAEDSAHITIDLDYRRARRGALLTGTLIGAFPVGAVAGALVAGVGEAVIGGLSPAAVITTIGSTMALSATIGTSIAAAQFRQLRQRATDEVGAILDRLGSGGRLDPPLSPWRRRLRRAVWYRYEE